MSYAEDLDDHRRVCEKWSRTDDSLNGLVHDALTRLPHQPNAEWGLQRRAASRINPYPQGVAPREGLSRRDIHSALERRMLRPA